MSKGVLKQLDNTDKNILQLLTEQKGFRDVSHIAHVTDISAFSALARLEKLTKLGYTEKFKDSVKTPKPEMYQVVEQGQIVAHLMEAADLLQGSDKDFAGEVNRIVEKFMIRSED